MVKNKAQRAFVLRYQLFLSFMFLSMLGCQSLYFKCFFVFCACCVSRLGFLSKLAHACILHACTGQSMHIHVAGPCTQACACARICIPLPRNSNTSFYFVFFAYLTCYAFVLIIFHRYKSLLYCILLVCLLYVKLDFIFCFFVLMP